MAKKIIITESQLKKAVTDSVNKILREEKLIKNFNFVFARRFGDVIGDIFDGRIDEGLIKSYPADKVENIVRRHLGLDNDNRKEYLFRSIGENGGDVFSFLLPTKSQYRGAMETNIERAMNACGYYLANSFLDKYTISELKGGTREKQENPIEFKILQYEKNFDDIVNVKQWSYIYHITSKRHLENIRKIGLMPKSTNNAFNYPERVYFMKGSVQRSEAKKLADMLKYVKENNPNFNPLLKNNNDYVLLQIDTSNLNDNMIFYNGQDFSSEIFTYSNIPPSAIKLVDFSVLP